MAITMRRIVAENVIHPGATPNNYIGETNDLIFDITSKTFYYYEDTGSTRQFVPVTGGSGGGSTVVNNTTIVNNQVLSLGISTISVAGGSMTVYAPASPSPGDVFTVFAYGVSPTNVLTVDFTSDGLHGSPDTAIFDVNFGAFTFTYVNPTLGWILTARGI